MARRRKQATRPKKKTGRPPSNETKSTRNARPSSTVPIEVLNGIELVPIADLKAYRLNARKHPKKQLRKLAKSIEEFGFVFPVLIDASGTVIAGHGRILAAEEIGLEQVPVNRITHLSDEQVRALRIADNRLTEIAEWDEQLLALELQFLVEVDFDVEITGFETAEIDLTIENQLASVEAGPADVIPEPDVDQPPVTQLGDLWLLDEHRLCCGDARDQTAYEVVMDGRPAQMVITDPPYNVVIEGNVCGSGSIHHPEFMMASGEMTEKEYEAFLTAVVRCLAQFSKDGSMHFLFIDWRHHFILERVCRRYYAKQINLCIWVKTNGGMGPLYRSQHELVLVFKNGETPHINNVQLGKFNRNRTNIWRYEGANSINPDRRDELLLHPTVKPVALVSDAIRDCSKRKGLILDPFLGSGTTVIACEETGRTCVGIELDPRYVDVAIRRWQEFTGNIARQAATGLSFDELVDIRNASAPLLPPPTGSAVTEA